MTEFVQKQINALQEASKVQETILAGQGEQLNGISASQKALHKRMDKQAEQTLTKDSFSETLETQLNGWAISALKKAIWALVLAVIAGAIGWASKLFGS